MFFVMRSNDSFNFPLGLIKYICYCCYCYPSLYAVCTRAPRTHTPARVPSHTILSKPKPNILIGQDKTCANFQGKPLFQAKLCARVHTRALTHPRTSGLTQSCKNRNKKQILMGQDKICANVRSKPPFQATDR